MQTIARVLLLLLLIGLMVLLRITSVASFDTGHHLDLTHNAMDHVQYNGNASSVAGLFNWFTDYFSFNVEISSDFIPHLRMMHFSNVHFLPQTAAYWTQLVLNTRRAVQSMATDHDVLGCLLILGVSIHTVQDFYSHSNWVEMNPRVSCDCYSKRTFFQAWNEFRNDSSKLNSLINLRTYSHGECDAPERNCATGFLPHGDYCHGVNKDSYVRPLWESSHTLAFIASLEWIANVELWASQVNPDLLLEAKAWRPSSTEAFEELRQDLESARIISYALQWFGEDGHWKGAGSGDLERFGTASFDFINRNSVYKEMFEEDRLWEPLTEPNLVDAPESFQLENDTNSTLSNIISVDDLLKGNDSIVNDMVAVVVRTVRVEGEDSLFDTPSFYARIDINGQEFIETPQSDKAEFDPYWTSIKYVSSHLEKISIGYTLMLDNFPNDDDILPLDSASGPHLNLTLDLRNHSISGDRFGVYNRSNALSVSFQQNSDDFFKNNNNNNRNDFYHDKTRKYNNNDTVRVKIYFSVRPINQCDFHDNEMNMTFMNNLHNNINDYLQIQQMYSNLGICDNTAYYELGLHPVCDHRGQPSKLF